MRKIKLALLMLVAVASVNAQSNLLKTNSGAPVGDNQNSQTAGVNGPVLLQDIHLVEKLASFDRERIPERVVHARGTGAFGEFVAEADLSAFTKAKLFSAKGKVTPMAVRFSTDARRSLSIRLRHLRARDCHLGR